MDRIVAYICYGTEPGEGAALVYASDAGRALDFAAAGEDTSHLTVLRHPPGDGLCLTPGWASDPTVREQAGLAGANEDGLDCPSCGLVLGATPRDPAPCLCPRCGFRICEGQV